MRGADAVIEISEFAESCVHGVRSVLRNRERFCALHMVQYGHDGGATPPYAGWEADVAALGFPVVWHTTLDPTKLLSEVVVYVQPDHQVLEGALQELMEPMEDPHARDVEYGVSSVLYIEEEAEASPPSLARLLRQAWGALILGFVPVLLVLDSLRSAFNMRRYHRTCDLRAQLVTRTYPKRVELAPTRWYLWEFFTRIHRSVYGGAALMQMVDISFSPGAFVLRTIKTHRHLGWRTLWSWWFPFLVYYAVFALPWWMPAVFGSQYRGYFSLLLVRNPLHPAWLTLYTLHAAAAAILSWVYIRYPRTWMWGLHATLFPVYFTLSPLILLYGRFYVSHAAWQPQQQQQQHAKSE